MIDTKTLFTHKLSLRKTTITLYWNTLLNFATPLRVPYDVIINKVALRWWSYNLSQPAFVSGTRWITHKISALQFVVDKFGIYIQHLQNMSEDPSFKAMDRSENGSRREYHCWPVSLWKSLVQQRRCLWHFKVKRSTRWNPFPVLKQLKTSLNASKGRTLRFFQLWIAFLRRSKKWVGNIHTKM